MPIKAKDYIKETLKERPELEAPLREVSDCFFVNLSSPLMTGSMSVLVPLADGSRWHEGPNGQPGFKLAEGRGNGGRNDRNA